MVIERRRDLFFGEGVGFFSKAKEKKMAASNEVSPAAENVLALGIAVQHLTEENRQLKEEIESLKEQIGSDATYLFLGQRQWGEDFHVFHSRAEFERFVKELFGNGAGMCQNRYQNMMDEFERLLDQARFQSMTPVSIFCDCCDPANIMRAFSFEAFKRA